MSHFTYNGQPIGYYEEVVEQHKKNLAAAVSQGVIGTEDSKQIQELAPGESTKSQEQA